MWKTRSVAKVVQAKFELVFSFRSFSNDKNLVFNLWKRSYKFISVYRKVKWEEYISKKIDEQKLISSYDRDLLLVKIFIIIDHFNCFFFCEYTWKNLSKACIIARKKINMSTSLRPLKMKRNLLYSFTRATYQDGERDGMWGLCLPKVKS